MHKQSKMPRRFALERGATGNTWHENRLRDLEAPTALANVAARRASPAGDLILMATGPDATSLAMAQNAAHMLARLGLDKHALLLAESLETCERIGERIFGADACFWSSRILNLRPSGSVSLQRYWDWRFKFYWAKKHYMAASRAGCHT